MPPISVMIKPASGMCNMSCAYCFYSDEARKRSCPSYGLMSEQTLKNVIRKTVLEADGVVSYAFQGGEPTLRGLDFFRKAVSYQEQYNRKGISVQNALQTNGLLLDEDWCDFLAQNHFLVGLSVDGTEAIHDSLRRTKAGEGTFARVSKAADLMDRHQVDYNILTVVTPQVARDVEKIYRFYESRGWRYQQYIACLDPLQEGHGATPYSLSPEEYGEFLIRLFELWYRDWKKGTPPYIRQFENYVGLAAGYLAESCDMLGVCGVQNVVEADGSVYPCDFYMLDEYRLGNFNQDRMDSINEKRRLIGFRERSMKLAPSCKACPYGKMCRGGCQRNRDWNAAGGFYVNYFCKGYRMFFDACLDRVKEVSESLFGR